MLDTDVYDACDIARALYVTAGPYLHAGQGLDVDLSYFQGANNVNNRLSYQQSKWAREIAAAGALLRTWTSERSTSKPCTGPVANLCGSSVSKADDATLLVAASPATYDTRNTTQNRGLNIAPEPRNQGDCNACVAYALAAAAQSAAAAALQQNSTKVPFPSPRQLFWCGGDHPDCTTGWKLQQAMQVLDSSRRWAKDGLYSDECLNMSAVTNKLNTEDLCKPTCPIRVPQGTFTYTSVEPLKDVSAIQQHILTYGAAVVTRMTLAQDFREYFTSNKTAVYDNPKAAKELSGSGENHAVVLAGYNNIESYWIIWSSWGKYWADGGFARVRFNQLGIADPSFTYGVIFRPKQPPPSPYSLTPSSDLQSGCNYYQAQYEEYVSRVAWGLGIPLPLLLNLNLGRIDSLGGWLPPGKKLIICGVQNGSQGASQTAAQSSTQAGNAPAAAVEGIQYALTWTSGSFRYQLYKPARTWKQAEVFCTLVGEGYHLASISTDQEFKIVSSYLVYANLLAYASSYSHGHTFILGCGDDGNQASQTVWTGLHDPQGLNQSQATWQTVADTFVWSDGSSSPFLQEHPNDYFIGGVEKQDEHCIGFTFCSKQEELARLDKHPCAWEMSFLCKGPA